MIKIQINSVYGDLLFEYEKENNTLKDTVINAVSTDADLTDADLVDAYLADADLTGANLTGANLTGTYLAGANLAGANLTDANLAGANLAGANLTDANLRGFKIKRAVVFTGLYDYKVIPFITEDNIQMVKMGCHTRPVTEWDENFWNNDNEFPNNGSKKSNMRLFAYNTAKKWFESIQ